MLPDEVLPLEEVFLEELEEVSLFEANGLIQQADRIYEFSSFEALRQHANRNLTEMTFAYYSKASGDLEISANLTIPENLTVMVGGSISSFREFGSYGIPIYLYNGVKTWPATVHVQNGVSLVINGALEASSVVIDGDVQMSTQSTLSGFNNGNLSGSIRIR